MLIFDSPFATVFGQSIIHFSEHKKALHNAVERKLCQEGWTRLCRWFIQLADEKEQPSAAISLNFFLNGITICCAIEPGTPPSLTRLRPTQTAPELLPMEVITAPWGLRGYFSGQCYRSIDQCVRKMNEEWKDFYPYALPPHSENDDAPVAVELAVGDGNCAFKVIYPARMVFTNITHSQEEVADQDDCSRIREDLNRDKIEHTVMTLTKHASRDVLPDTQNQTPFPGALSPFQPIEKNECLRPPPRTTLTPGQTSSSSSDKAKKFRLSTFHKKLGQDRFDSFCETNPVELHQPTNTSSEVTPTSSAPTSVKTENKEEEREKFEEPPSPKWVQEKVDVWVGLKLPLDATGSTLKSESCRPKLELDGLEPEVIYQKRHENRTSVDSLIFSEFKPRKRLKRSTICEEQEPIGIKRLAPESQPQPGELKPPIKKQNEDLYEWDVSHKPIGIVNSDPYKGYGVLTPSPEQASDDRPSESVRPKMVPKSKPPKEPIIDSMMSTLTPPTPKQDFERDGWRSEKDARLTRRKSTYELAEEKAQFGVYAPYRGELASGQVESEKVSSYQPSWKAGSNANKMREARRAKQKMKEQQKTMLAESVAASSSAPKMSQPLTPGSSTRNPRTPGMAPNTPGTAPPSTPTYNPRTPGGPPSVGPVTPFGAPHTPGSMRNPHTPARSPGQAIAPSPASRADFSAPKTPRTPRTPGSVRTPGSKSTFGGRISGVSSLQEISAVLLSLVLGDSVLDAHRDRNFIQAPLCVCHGDTVGIDGPLIGIRTKEKDDEFDECTCGFSAVSCRSSAVGRWGGILLEDEVNLVGAEIEADAFHIRARNFLDDCLRTTPEIRSKNGVAGIGKPNLQLAGQLLGDLVAKFGSDGLIDNEDYWNDDVYDLWNFALFHDAVSACSEALKMARCVLEPTNTISFPREVSENVITEFSLPQSNNNSSKTANHETIRLLR